jgi:hypothetical protein
MTPLDEEGGAHCFRDDKNKVPDGKGNIIESGIFGTEEVHNEDWHHKPGDILEEACEIV